MIATERARAIVNRKPWTTWYVVIVLTLTFFVALLDLFHG